MPRNGSGAFSLPAGYRATPNTTATANQHNSAVEDLEADANHPRPVTAGGTGAITAADARDNFGLGVSDDVTFGGVAAFGGGTGIVRAQNANSGSGASDGLEFSIVADGRGYIWNYESDLFFATSGVQRLSLIGSGDNTYLRLQTPASGTSGLNGMEISSTADGRAFLWNYESSIGFGTTGVQRMVLSDSGLAVIGTLSKSSGTFLIDHPVKPDTHRLQHSFIEGGRIDNIYRGTVDLVAGEATVDLDAAVGMTPGTFEALNRDAQVWLQNDSGWTQVRGSVSGATLNIEAESATTDTVSWLVMAERRDQHIMDAAITDEDGRLILEPEK